MTCFPNLFSLFFLQGAGTGDGWGVTGILLNLNMEFYILRNCPADMEKVQYSQASSTLAHPVGAFARIQQIFVCQLCAGQCCRPWGIQ